MAAAAGRRAASGDSWPTRFAGTEDAVVDRLVACDARLPVALSLDVSPAGGSDGLPVAPGRQDPLHRAGQCVGRVGSEQKAGDAVPDQLTMTSDVRGDQ